VNHPLDAVQVDTLAAAITSRYAVTVWLGAGAGLRERETLGLTAARVDFLRRKLHILEQMQNQVLSPLKTTASRRVVPADDPVLAAVTAHMTRWQRGPGGLLVTNRCGRPVQRNSFGHCWREAVAAARTCGRPPAPPRERGTCAEAGCADPAHCLPAGTRYHDLRHFYASTLIAAGLHPKAIQSRLGHATIAETMDTYGHLFADADEQGRGAIDAMFSSGRPGLASESP
jgi:integrase